MALISIRLSDWELQELDKRALAAEVSRSKLVRDVLFGADTDQGIPASSCIHDEVVELRAEIDRELAAMDLDDVKRRISALEDALVTARGY